MNLSDDQADACERIREWVYARCDTWREGQPAEILTMGGYAGVGKSALLGVLAAEFQKQNLLVAYATFTGRASSILARKLADQDVITSNRQKATSPRQLEGKFAKYFLQDGEERMPFCGTLHRLLYAPFIDEETEELMGWRTRPKLDRRYGLIVVDEASMVGDTMLRDIVRHGVPVLAVGDHGQLSPVMDSGSLMKNPDIRLETIHRQAEGNLIIQLSRIIRETGCIDRKLGGKTIAFDKRVAVGGVYRNALSARHPADGEGVYDWLGVGALCWTNKTRIGLNRAIRKAFEFTGAPKMGEVLMCLRNSDTVSNGMRGILMRDAEQLGWKLDVELDFPYEEVRGEFELCGYAFNRERPFKDIEELQKLAPGIRKLSDAGMMFDWGYAATVHKFQGSQLKHAIVVLDRPANPSDPEYRKWAYTAVTRASERLTILQ